uniref:Fibulin 2 n=1 Tax=Seriola lalandi dorsalis TaxID=1841481 RepID=A0A3B4XQX7_SERLL
VQHLWEKALFLCWRLLCMDICLSQKDCTGVDCPVLQNCFETVLENGACCPSCTQKGCTCEGYQYYDCIQAGFREGKVPEGESYFVDFGSTECSCPQGGGKISCHFIPCPEISPNCIEILQPADGCTQCRRIGCTHGSKKYEAGHSFQLDQCQVCHCPKEGGRLMCSPIPGCDLRSVNKPTWVTTIENNNPLRDITSRHDNQQMSPVEPFSKLWDKSGYGCLGFITVSAKDLVKTCCETGEKWAAVNGHCNNMEPPTRDRTAQQQCCLGFLRESRCLAGINAARAGSMCEEDASDKCGIDSYKECCGCCSMGLQFRSEGHHCEAHHYLGYHCRHVFLNCCKGEEGLKRNPPYRCVSDSPYPKEAFSIGEERDGENAVEGPVEVEDMDECLIYEGKICHHRCVNTPGSYRCECFTGYVLQEDAFSCAQGKTVDEENRLKEDDRAAVDPTAPLPPPSQPTAPVNPCEGNSPCEQQCTPVGGRPQCSCFSGFSLRADGHSCEDVNECLSAHACQLNERCVNTAGSYICQRQITCPPGYQINNDICEDINECVEGRHNCGLDFECVNTAGSFRCNPKAQCPVGFNQDAQGNCVDIDECGALAQPCSPGFNCINTAGSYMCQRKIICSRGYHASPDGSRCIDVDECQSSLHRCGAGQLCHNLPGSYRCECQTGYQYDSFRRMCVDVNECWRYPSRLCAQTCENTPGSYECSCTSGFRLSGDGKNCEDVNECLASPCSQECANIYGSYQCYCRQGYYLREDGHTCEDIDECSQSIGHLCTYKCVNVPGSYRCACPEYGYTMSPNGRSCKDIDECATGAHNCSLAETCYNIQGGYRCLSLSCPPNYRKVSDTRCERISCPNYLECQNSPLRITYYYLSFQSNIVIPAQIFRIGPSPAYSGDNVIVSITQGNEENYFSTRKLNAYTGAVYLHRQVEGPRDFLINVEMKLWRQGTFTTFQAKIYVFITVNSL